MNRSVARTLQLLDAVAYVGVRGAGLMELSETTGLDKSTALRLLETARVEQWLTRDNATRRYRLGAKALALTSRQQSDVAMLTVQSELQRLRETSGETASFHLRAGDVRVAVVGVESQHEIRRAFRSGEICPLSRGAASKAVLAYVDPAEQELILDDGDDRTSVFEQLEAVRRQGFLSTDGDRTVGVGAVASPVFAGSRVLGSIAVSGPSSRFDGAARERVAPTVAQRAKRLNVAFANHHGREFAP